MGSNNLVIYSPKIQEETFLYCIGHVLISLVTLKLEHQTRGEGEKRFNAELGACITHRH